MLRNHCGFDSQTPPKQNNACLSNKCLHGCQGHLWMSTAPASPDRSWRLWRHGETPQSCRGAKGVRTTLQEAAGAETCVPPSHHESQTFYRDDYSKCRLKTYSTWSPAKNVEHTHLLTLIYQGELMFEIKALVNLSSLSAGRLLCNPRNNIR